MAVTNIEWATDSWNPIRALLGDATGHHCVKVSPGCANCYASTMQRRFRMPPYDGAGSKAVESFLDEKVLAAPLRWKKPRRIFVCSMTDLFGEWVPDEWIDRVFAVAALCPQHQFLILTKRAKRMADYTASHDVGLRWGSVCNAGMSALSGGQRRIVAEEAVSWTRHGLPNCWLGVSAEDQQRADERIPHLLGTPAAVRWVSAEPLLGPIRFSGPGCAGCFQNGSFYNGTYFPCRWCFGIDWVVVGGESGAKARPCNVAWIRSIRDQCRGASVACFVKQLGARPYLCRGHDSPAASYGATVDCRGGQEAVDAGCRRFALADRKGGNPAEWPADLADLLVRDYPDT